MFYDLGFLDEGNDKAACTLPEDILKPMRAARSCAKDIPGENKVLSFVELRKLMLANASTLTSLDRSFKLELEFLDGPAEKVLGAALDAKALGCLPSSGVAKSMQASVMALNDLQKSRFYSMMSSTHQARVDAVLELVSNMMRGITPDAKIGVESEFFGAVLARLEAFMRLDIAGAGDEPARTLVSLRLPPNCGSCRLA